jgi:hypothetical protein
MTKADLRKRIVGLVRRRSDPYLLNEIYAMLAAETNASSIKARLVAAVMEGEAEIAAGRSIGLQTFERRIKGSLRRKIAARRPRRKRA